MNKDYKKLDAILKFISHEDRNYNNITASVIRTEVLPKLEQAEVEILMMKIIDSKPDIAKIMTISGNRIAINSTDYTRAFLKNGGFTNIYEVEKVKNNKIESKNKLETKLTKSNIEANKLNERIAERNEKNERTNIISTWVNIAIGVLNAGLLAWQILKD